MRGRLLRLYLALVASPAFRYGFEHGCGSCGSCRPERRRGSRAGNRDVNEGQEQEYRTTDACALGRTRSDHAPAHPYARLVTPRMPFQRHSGDREAYLALLTHNTEDAPEEFKLWVREWPARAVWPGLAPDGETYRCFPAIWSPGSWAMGVEASASVEDDGDEDEARCGCSEGDGEEEEGLHGHERRCLGRHPRISGGGGGSGFDTEGHGEGKPREAGAFGPDICSNAGHTSTSAPAFMHVHAHPNPNLKCITFSTGPHPSSSLHPIQSAPFVQFTLHDNLTLRATRILPISCAGLSTYPSAHSRSMSSSASVTSMPMQTSLEGLGVDGEPSIDVTVLSVGGKRTLVLNGRRGGEALKGMVYWDGDEGEGVGDGGGGYVVLRENVLARSWCEYLERDLCAAESAVLAGMVQ